MSKLGKNCIELNRMVRATCLGVKSAIKCPQIVSAACGDLDVDSVQEFLRTNPSQAFYVAAGGGFLNVVKYLYVVGVCVCTCVEFQNIRKLTQVLSITRISIIKNDPNIRIPILGTILRETRYFVTKSEKDELHWFEPR